MAGHVAQTGGSAQDEEAHADDTECINLGSIAPCGRLASTASCLAQPGLEYLVYRSDSGEVTVDLSHSKGTFVVEWVHPVKGVFTPGGTTSGGVGSHAPSGHTHSAHSSGTSTVR